MRVLGLLLLLFLGINQQTVAQSRWPGSGLPQLLPRPVAMKLMRGDCHLAGTYALAYPEDDPRFTPFAESIHLFLSEISALTPAGEEASPDLTILLQFSDSDPMLGNEGYDLLVAPNRIHLTAAQSAGLFYGIQTFCQLFPPAAFEGAATSLPAFQIKDWPRFAWRGLMIDEATRFLGKAEICRLLHLMAEHKLNVFHWVLGRDSNWRVAIPEFPELTVDSKAFYSLAEIREIVALAEKLHITVIPEFSMPTRATMLHTAYPIKTLDPKDQSASRDRGGRENNLINPANGQVYDLIGQLFDQLIPLFPGPYFHVGAYERPATAWDKSPMVKQLMDTLKYTELAEVEQYFYRRIDDLLLKHRKVMVGWEGLLVDTALRSKTTVQVWSGMKTLSEVQAKGYEPVLAFSSHFHLDMAYSPNDPGQHWAGYTSTEEIYGLELPADDRPLLGVHAIYNQEASEVWPIDEMLFPRLCAIAEVAWTPQALRFWREFKGRLNQWHCPRLSRMGVDFRIPLPEAYVEQGLTHFALPYEGAEVYYTLEGTTPDENSNLYEGPFELPTGSQLRMVTKMGERLSRVSSIIGDAPILNWSLTGAGRNFAPIEWDITDHISGAGIYTFTINFTGGRHAMQVRTLSIREDSGVVASDHHMGLIGPVTEDNVYKIMVPVYDSEAVYKLRADARALGGTECFGSISMHHAPLRPRYLAKSTLPHFRDHTPEKGGDWDPNTYFWSNREPVAGDSFTVIYGEELRGTMLKVYTGKAESGRDILLGGLLEYSSDGENFEPVAPLKYGMAEVPWSEDKPVKALRLSITQDQDKSWLVIRDLIVE